MTDAAHRTNVGATGRVEAQHQSDTALPAYPAGHHASVIRSHTSRDAYNSAAHLLPHLRIGMSILDVGCGPGTITTSLASIVGPSGRAVGIDPSESVIAQAKQLAACSNSTNVTFFVGDAVKGLGDILSSTDNPDGFDVVHAHQVLQHVADPVAMLREMRRVCKKDSGIISLKTAEVNSVIIYPDLPLLNKTWKELYDKVARSGGAQPDAARRQHAWLRQAGFDNRELIEVSASVMMYGQSRSSSNAHIHADESQGSVAQDGEAHAREERKWWGTMWAERTAHPDSGWAKTALQKGFAMQDELNEIAEAWLEWSRDEDAYFGMINSDIICRLG